MQATETAPRRPAGHIALRRPGSVRRTSTIDTTWPQGQGQPMLMQGHARDLLTPADGSSAQTLAEGRFEILASPKREVLSVKTTPDKPALSELIGQRAGGNLRAHLARDIPEEKAAGTPLYLILDDFCGASLVAGWAWSRWVDDWLAMARQSGQASTAGKFGKMEGICTGFAPGSTALNPDGTSNRNQNFMPVGPLLNPEDPLGWHDLAHQEGVGMRRARWIDLWTDGDVIQMEVGFQDSSTAPQGGRIAIHEYRLQATADRKTKTLLTLEPDPRVLPYKECPGAVANVNRLIGSSLGEMREKVLEVLPGSLGCTHLNDVMRSLAEAPQLLAKLG